MKAETPRAELYIVVPGAPQPKQRARQGRGGHFYTPEATRAYELAVKAFALGECMRAGWPRDVRKVPFGVSLDIYFPDERPRDCDNVLKSILDGCNRIIWHDDRQVHEHAVRRHVDRVRPRAEIRVRRIAEEQLTLSTGTK